MTVQKILNAILYGVSGDTKPTTYANNTLFFEQDTGNVYRWNSGGSSWDLLSGASKTETLTNKTLTSPVISSISNTGTLTLPTSTDTLVGRATTDTLTNKTVNATNNTITDSSTALGDILKSNGTKFVRLARGSNNQILTSTATDIQWSTLSLYTEAKGSATKSGDASATTFTIAHTLGGTPTYYEVTPTAQEANGVYWLTVDGTNITINYNFPPPSGSSNLTYNWRAAL